MTRRFPLTTRLLALVVLPALVAAWWLHASLKASLPGDGVVQLVHGVSSPTTIERDANGVPHVLAGSDADAYFAIGYAHAQDRLWQLELQKRMASGRMSEAFGKKSIEADVWFRTLGLYEAARTAWPALSPEAQASLTAYAAGINAWIDEKHALPVEFRVLGVEPEHWTELDSLAWVKVFALDLGGNFRREIEHYIAAQSLTRTQLAAFFPGYPVDAPTETVASSARETDRLLALARFQQRLEREHALGGRNVGSNAWVVSGRHAKDGAALLANDPHLGLQMPSLWYAISVDAPTFKVSGMSLVGLPVAVLGRNAHIAWGGTNMMADTQDLYFERADPTGENHQVDGRWQPFQVRTETIEVRADFPEQLRKQFAPVALKVRSTRHGPVISDYYGVFDQPVALRWTALDAGDTSYEAFFRLNHARDWESFQAALSLHVAPAMNILYSDRHGNIGYVGAGRIPIRKRGEGTLPVPGWDDAHGWNGEVPPAQWPQSYNPASGYIVSANDAVANPAHPHFISHDWASPARARRIAGLLQARIDAGERLTIEDMQRIQGDTTDLEVVALLAELKTRLPEEGHAAQAAILLKGWDGDMRGDSQAAAIFTVWMRHFRRQVFGDELLGSWENAQAAKMLRSLQGDVSLDYLRALLRRDEAGWCDDRETVEQEGCDEVLADSQESALWELYKLRGDWSMASWRWDQVQRTSYSHTPFGSSKSLARLFDRRIGNGGSSNAINVAGSSFSGADGYLQTFGAGFRQIIALHGDRAEHRYMNSTGQSGNVMSPHYDDMVAPFRDVRYVELHSSIDRAPNPGAN
jgi:penicillin G amidase